MVKIGENSPLSISEEAQNQLELMREAQNHAKNAFLRVKANVPVFGNSVAFNMFFDMAKNTDDMIYQQGKTGLILDPDTARHLVGSELVMLPSGELAFTHLDTSMNLGQGEKPIYN